MKKLQIGTALLTLFLLGTLTAHPTPSHAEGELASIQAMPLVGPDVVERLPAPFRNLIYAARDMNASVTSWAAPALSRKGERISEALQRILRAAVAVAISVLAWCIVIATKLVGIVASVAIGIINWLLAFGHTL